MALNAYRHVLKSARLAFEGDQHLFAAAQMQARTAFKSNAGLDPNDSLAKKAVIHAEEVAAILRQNIVQGKKEEGSERYRLKIRKDTERGDNDTIKMPNGQKVSIDGKKCCSS